MAKKKRRAGENWSSADHADRKAKQQLSSNKRAKQASVDSAAPLQPPPPSTSLRRTAARTRNSQEKRDAERLRLHMIKVQRHIDALKTRLQSWDPVEEKQRQEKERRDEEDKKQQQLLLDANIKTKKKGRKGPETWKLRGGAKPAWEVYDFDTRYVDPHIKAHEAAKQKAARSLNLFHVYKGRFGKEATDGSIGVATDDAPPQPFCRDYLALLMQLALLAMEANKMKTAMTALEECVELDGFEQHAITNARCRLMRIYLQVNQPQLARSLWERCFADSNDNHHKESSVWIQYSAALLEYVSWKILREQGSSRHVAETMLAQAIQANVFCVYYLAFYSNFASVMEYTDDIEDAPEGTLEEAIEYCCSEQYSLWSETEGALDWIRSFLGRVLYGGSNTSAVLPVADLDWNAKLTQVEQEHDAAAAVAAVASSPSDHKEDEHDSKMYCGMFRTAMEMLDESGETKNILEGAVASTIIDDEPEGGKAPSAVADSSTKLPPVKEDSNADDPSDDESEDS